VALVLSWQDVDLVGIRFVWYDALLVNWNYNGTIPPFYAGRPFGQINFEHGTGL